MANQLAQELKREVERLSKKLDRLRLRLEKSEADEPSDAFKNMVIKKLGDHQHLYYEVLNQVKRYFGLRTIRSISADQVEALRPFIEALPDACWTWHPKNVVWLDQKKPLAAVPAPVQAAPTKCAFCGKPIENEPMLTLPSDGSTLHWFCVVYPRGGELRPHQRTRILVQRLARLLDEDAVRPNEEVRAG